MNRIHNTTASASNQLRLSHSHQEEAVDSQGSNVFANAQQVGFDGVNAFTSAGRDIHNVTVVSAPPSHYQGASSVLTTPARPRRADRQVHGATPLAGDSPPRSLGSFQLSDLGEHDSETYARLFLPKKLGWPLWQPRPLMNLPVACRERGVSIGDVGIITADGEFDFFFNISLPADHPVNRNKVPDHFVPLNHPEDPEDVNHSPGAWPPGQCLCTSSVQYSSIRSSVENMDVSYQFTAAAPAGAILLVPQGGMRENLLNVRPYKVYAEQNAAHWYKYINGPRGRAAANGSVYLITGVDKTQFWANGVYTDLSAAQEPTYLTFQKAAQNSEDLEAPDSGYTWVHSHPVTTKYGPQASWRDEANRNMPFNQCIFLRGYRVALSEGLWGSLMGGVEVTPIQGSSADLLLRKSPSVPFGDSSGGNGNRSLLGASFQGFFGVKARERSGETRHDARAVVISEIPVPSLHIHPSDVINQYLLAQNQNPFADVAITHDDTWCSVLDDNADSLPNWRELFERLFERYGISSSSAESVTLEARLEKDRSTPMRPKPEWSPSNEQTKDQPESRRNVAPTRFASDVQQRRLSQDIWDRRLTVKVASQISSSPFENRVRAVCLPCFTVKAKCDEDAENPEGPCQRCVSRGLRCYSKSISEHMGERLERSLESQYDDNISIINSEAVTSESSGASSAMPQTPTLEHLPLRPDWQTRAREPPPTDPPAYDEVEALIRRVTSTPLSSTRTSLIVENLPHQIQSQDLEDLFRRAGPVLYADIANGLYRIPRGRGAVFMATETAADCAVNMFNGYSWKSRILDVRHASSNPVHHKPSPVSDHIKITHYGPMLPAGSSFTPAQDTPANNQQNRTIFVGNLPFRSTWQDLKGIFDEVGTVTQAYIPLGPDGRSRGFGKVTFATDLEAERAIEIFNGCEFNGRILRVNMDRPRGGPVQSSKSPSVNLRKEMPVIAEPAVYTDDHPSLDNYSDEDFPPLPSRIL